MTILLNVKKRIEKKKKVDGLRSEGYIPAVLYGHKVENVNLSVSVGDFNKLYKLAGESTLIDLNIDESSKPVKVIIQDVQVDAVKRNFLHIDFHQVNMKEKLHTHIGLVFTGEAYAVKNFGGVLVTNKDTIEVKCLPTDLVSEITVDLSSLKNLEDTIRIKNLIIPRTIEVLDNPDEIVAIVSESKTEKDAATMTQAPTDVKVEPEVIGKKEKEEAVKSGEAPVEVKPEKK